MNNQLKWNKFREHQFRLSKSSRPGNPLRDKKKEEEKRKQEEQKKKSED